MLWHSPICRIRDSLSSGVHSILKFLRNPPETSTRASMGQGKNQSIEHWENREGNIAARVLNLVPTGEKAKTICYWLTFTSLISSVMKKLMSMEVSFLKLHLSTKHALASTALRRESTRDLTNTMKSTLPRKCLSLSSTIAYSTCCVLSAQLTLLMDMPF